MSNTDTRQRIMDTATTLFSCHGFCATSIDDILKGVGITKGAFYHYFKGKEHLCGLIVDRAVAEYHQLAESLPSEESDSGPLHQWYRMIIEKQTSGQWLYCRLLMRLTIESTELSGAMRNKLKTFWLWCQNFHETLIRQSAALPPELRISPAELARLCISAHFGAVWLDRSAPAAQDMTTVCETLLKLMLR